MANLENVINQAISDFDNIKETIEENGIEVVDGTDTSEYGKLISKAVEQNRQSGYDDGHATGYDVGYDAGKKAYSDEWWENFKSDINTSAGLFAGNGWDNTTFNPNFSITVNNAQNMFWYNLYNGDLVELCNNNQIVIDFSKSINFGYCFSNSKFTHIGVVDFANCTSLQYVFYNCENLQTIDKLVLYEKNTYTSMLSRCPLLENLTIEGTIAQNGFNVSGSPLTHESLVSIINALKDGNGSSTGLKVTLGNDNIGRLTNDDKQRIIDKGWTYA